MHMPHKRVVYQRRDGSWANKGTNALRASSVHETQAGAIAAARRMLKSCGGGKLTIRDRDNKIQGKYAIEADVSRLRLDR